MDDEYLLWRLHLGFLTGASFFPHKKCQQQENIIFQYIGKSFQFLGPGIQSCWISCIRPDIRPIWYPIHPHCFSLRGPDSLGKSSRMGETALANRVLHTLKLVLEADFNSHTLVADIIHLEVIIKMTCLNSFEYGLNLPIPLPTNMPGEVPEIFHLIQLSSSENQIRISTLLIWRFFEQWTQSWLHFTIFLYI